jgi:3-dehydrosphinganine reductase
MSIPSWASVIIALGAATALAVIGDYIYNSLTRVPFKPTGKACFITGGSTGLGKSLAIELAKKGADVCIIARRVSELESAVEEIKVKLFFSKKKRNWGKQKKLNCFTTTSLIVLVKINKLFISVQM